MRGKVDTSKAADQKAGITPAYAGKSRSGIFEFRVCGDHPRLCGEKRIIITKITAPNRITPAYAGKRFDGLFSGDNA